MSAAVERVARAIADTRPPPDPWNMETVWASTLIEARAAIAAIREPDEAMLEAGSRALEVPASWAQGETQPQGAIAQDEAHAIWQAMLHAALGAPPAGKDEPK